MSMNGATVRMGFADRNADQIELPMTHPAFGRECLSEVAHSRDGSLEQNGFNALLVVQMRMHRGDGQIVMCVLNAGQPFGQVTLVMVVHV